MPTSTTTPPEQQPQPKPRRSTNDRMLLGVCGGLATATGTSPLALRLTTLVIGAVLLPLVLLAYTVTALILPADDGTAILGDGERDQRDIAWAVGLSIAAVTFALTNEGMWSGWLAFFTLPIAAIAAFVLWLRDRGGRRETAVGPATDQATPAEPAARPTFTVGAQAPTVTMPAPPQPLGQEEAAGEPGEPDAPAAPEAPSFTPPAQSQPKVRRRSLALPVFAGMALIPAVATLLAAAGAIEASATAVAVVFGLMALVATLGAVAVAVLRPSYLGAAGLLLLAALFGTSSITVSQFGDLPADGLGERVYTPARASDLSQPFVLGVGELTVDLRDLPLEERQRVTVATELGFGQINVIVPRGARVVTAPTSDAQSVSVRATANGARDAERAPTIELDTELRGGEVVVRSGSARDTNDLEVLARQSVGFWSSGEERR